MLKFKRNLIFLIPLFFFTIQFSLRIVPGIFSQEMMQYFSMSASEFGIFSSIYYLGYAGMQIPIGILIDRFPVNKTISILIMICALASLMLAFSTNWMIASFARFLIGMASIAGYIGCVKVAKEIYDLTSYNKMIAITFSVGFIGAAICFIIGGINQNINSDNYGWKNILIYISVILISASVLAYIFLDIKSYDKVLNSNNIFADIKKIIKNKYIITTGLSGGAMVGVFEGFADIWGNNFLKISYSIDGIKAIFAASLIFFGIGIGSPLINHIANKSNQNAKVVAVCGLITSILFTLVLTGSINYYLLLLLCLLIGVLSGSQVVIFTMNTSKVDGNLVAITSAITNSLVMGFGIFFHSIIGYLLDYLSSSTDELGLNIYSIYDYQLALSIIPVACLIGSLIILYVNKKKDT